MISGEERDDPVSKDLSLTGPMRCHVFTVGTTTPSPFSVALHRVSVTSSLSNSGLVVDISVSNSVRFGSVMNAGGLDEGEDALKCEFVSKLLVCSCVLQFKYEIPFWRCYNEQVPSFISDNQ